MRLDTYLFEKGFFESREKAKKAISDGRVSINGRTVLKASAEASECDEISVAPSEMNEYVGRGGIKLEHALDYFDIDPSGLTVIDIGASTGGFTDCLLRRGAKKVFAVDIGHGQLHKSLLNDDRVVNMEGLNAREMTAETVGGEPVMLAVSDLSFISQRLIIPVVKNVLASGGIYVVLIKPQFEAGREHLNKHGIVKSEKIRLRVVEEILDFAKCEGYEVIGSTQSPIEGGSGNVEYLAAFRRK